MATTGGTLLYPPLLITVIGYTWLIERNCREFWCLNLDGWNCHQRCSSTGNTNKRLIVEKGFLIRKTKHLLVSNCHWTAMIKVLQKNYVFKRKCGYCCCCHMKWQLGSRECDREKNIFVHLTWEINSPNKWHDYISWLYFLNFKKLKVPTFPK